MMSLKKQLKQKLFGAAKRVLPASTVSAIQRQRLEGDGIRSHSSKPGSYMPFTTYAVVSAVYNVESYLDDYFESLMHQTIDPAALKVIVVDDGSTDSSADVIRSWQERFPERIWYLKKENGGQASARNLGMSIVDSEWVTFIDPDDFVSKDYFERIDRIVLEHSSLEMVSCNLIYYYESKGLYKNSHPLKFRFGHEARFHNVQDASHPVQLSMSSAFFKVASINEQGLRVNEEIRPNFEDADFINRYLLGLDKGTICFAPQPKYFYRKREDSSSTLDTSWSDNGVEKLLTVTRCHRSLLLYAKEKKKSIPDYIQNTIIYDLSWYFKRFVGHPQRYERYLRNGVAEQFLSILEEIFDNIDAQNIENARGAWLRYEWKHALLTRYKNISPSCHIAYVEMLKPHQKCILLRTCDPSMHLFLEGKEIFPLEEKKCSVAFFGQEFQTLWLRWYRYENESQALSYCTEKAAHTKLSVRGQQFKDRASVGELVGKFTEKWNEYPQSGSIWLIMDRDTQADDNGEHFYRWMTTNHPEQRCVFALRKTSPHWKRLEAEGFSLVDFGTKEYERELKRCSKIISSHADAYVHSYFGDNFYKSKDYVFLQHGVTKDDMSSWLNGKPIALFVTTTPQEYNSIVCDESPYRFTSRQVILSGFCRHDRLLEISQSDLVDSKTILIAPTWRQSLVGKTTGRGNKRTINKDFANSRYAREWGSFLSDARLKNYADEHSCKIVFFPHANILPYVQQGYFDIPDYVELGTCEGKSIQHYLANASLCVTDYSSVAFDIAYLGTPCIYYQFDQEEAFQGEHIYAKGYFDYSENGFGPVVTTKDELMNSLHGIALNDFLPSQMYQHRMDETFIFHDGKCCERVYEAIMALDKPL